MPEQVVVDATSPPPTKNHSEPPRSPRRSSEQPHNNKDGDDMTAKLWKENDPYHYLPPTEGDHWEQCMRRVDKHDDDMCNGWSGDIDTLLVFAGLFSSAVAAFTVESYQWLQADPGDSTNQLLIQISQQLSGGNSSSAPVSMPSFTPSASSIRVNIFWFSSLTLALVSAVVAILCKQWVREFRRDAAISHKDAVILRQIRAESWERWRVGHILSSLPVLLQLALALFCAGMLDLLWSINSVVAIVLTCVVGLAALFVSFTTVAPAIVIFYGNTLPCAYKSTQAWLFFSLLKAMQILNPFRFHPIRMDSWLSTELRTRRFAERRENGCAAAAMQWVMASFIGTSAMAPHILQCMKEEFPRWCDLYAKGFWPLLERNSVYRRSVFELLLRYYHTTRVEGRHWRDRKNYLSYEHLKGLLSHLFLPSSTEEEDTELAAQYIYVLLHMLKTKQEVNWHSFEKAWYRVAQNPEHRKGALLYLGGVADWVHQRRLDSATSTVVSHILGSLSMMTAAYATAYNFFVLLHSSEFSRLVKVLDDYLAHFPDEPSLRLGSAQWPINKAKWLKFAGKERFPISAE